MTGFESWIDRQIRDAEERGEFDNLPGAGKPIEGLDRRQDADWWVKGLMAREQLSYVLPTSLALRKEVEDLQETLAAEWSESTVREIVEDLNTRVVDARRRPVSGPPVYVKTVDVEATVAEWNRARAGRSGPKRTDDGVASGADEAPKGSQSGRFGWLSSLRKRR
jgi:DnaJ-like protein